MTTLKELINMRVFEVLLPLTSTELFTEELIHDTVKNEIGLIEYHYKHNRNETPQFLLGIIGDSVSFIEALVKNKNTSEETLKMLAKSNYPPLADFGTMKLALNKYNNR